MNHLNDYDKRMIEKNAKPGQRGATTVGCMYCRDQISGSHEYVENFEHMDWKKGGCMWATCPYWDTVMCNEHFAAREMRAFDPKKECFCYGK